MNSSRFSTFLVMAYSICVLLLPWTTYAAVTSSASGGSGQSIASVYAAMAQPILWEQKSITLKGTGPSSPYKTPPHNPGDPAVLPPPAEMRPIPARVFSFTTPYQYIELPTWRGLIPYSLPPPGVPTA